MIFLEPWFTSLQGIIAGILPAALAEAGFLVVYALTIFSVGGLFSAFGGLAERKIIARIHSRRGPMYTGPFGLLQTIADLFKFLRKEVIFPKGSDRWLFRSVPFLLVLPVFMAFVFMPFGSFSLYQSEYSLLFVLALLGITPVAILVAGWSSNSKYSTLGGLRAAGMMMSYEVLMVIAVASIALSVGSFDLVVIAEYQASHGWFVLLQPVAFVLFMIGIIASVERNPFDLVEAESELVSGWKTEYGGVYFALTLLGEYVKLLVSGMLFATLFFGGWTSILGDFLFLFMTLVFVVLMFFVRATALRLRMDQVFQKVWRQFIPLGLLNFIVTMFILAWLGGVF